MSNFNENKDIILDKGKKSFFKIVFSRMGLIILLIILQILLFVSAFRWLRSYGSMLYVIGIVISVLVIFRLVNKEMDPTSKLTWMFVISIAPVAGILLYLFITHDLGNKYIKNKVNSIITETEGYLTQDEEVLKEIKEENKEVYLLSSYVKNTANYPIYKSTKSYYYSTGEETIEEIIRELENAKEYIFMEYFIIKKGYVWHRILDVLERKAKEGVEVRLMYDGTGAFANLPYSYPQQIEKLGIQCRMFSPIRPFLSTHYNNRDHRKILVIDGKVAFTGGINLADEYVNIGSRFGHWKDNGIKIEGSGVNTFTLMFLQLWHHMDGEMDFKKYFRDHKVEDDGFVIPYGDTPTDSEKVGKSVYMDIINNAKEYLYIMSPYFIVDHEIVKALTLASKKGVDVRLLLPHIPDKKTIFAVAKTYYETLIKSGVKVYEYIPGFVHSKLFLSDDEIGVVGTINLDYRSLYHHYENGVYLYKSGSLVDIKRDFLDSFDQSKLMTLEELEKEPKLRMAVGKLLKIFAPLL